MNIHVTDEITRLQPTHWPEFEQHPIKSPQICDANEIFSPQDAIAGHLIILANPSSKNQDTYP